MLKSTEMGRISSSFLMILLVACAGEKEKDIVVPKLDIATEIAWDGQRRAGVFYEIFVRSFADSNGDGIGDLDGVTASLDYLNELGVSGIWLMPIGPSPSYHGYDVTDYRAVNPDYGTLEDLDELVAAAHAKGIKVILDFVMNHTSDKHPWFIDAKSSATSAYRNYYIFNGNDYVANFDKSMPDLNYGVVATLESMPAWEAMCTAGEFWLARGVDGFRLDAVKHLYDDENAANNAALLRKFRERMMAKKSDVYIIGEVLSEANVVVPYYAGLEALFDFSSWWRLEWAINNEAGKWYPKDLLGYEAMFAAVRPDYIHATKLSNHDEDRVGSMFGGDVAKMKMAAKVLLTASGNPYIYYGEEIGMLGTRATGDENVRDPFLWSAKATDTKRTTWRTSSFSTDATVRNLATQQVDKNSLWSVYSQFMKLRNADPVMAYGKMSLPEGFDDASQVSKQVMAFYREYNGIKYIVLHNLSATATSYAFAGVAKRGVWQHGGATVTTSSTKSTATLPAWSTVICEI